MTETKGQMKSDLIGRRGQMVASVKYNDKTK